MFLCIFAGSSCNLRFKASPAHPTCAERVLLDRPSCRCSCPHCGTWPRRGGPGAQRRHSSLRGQHWPGEEPGTEVASPASSELQPPPSAAGRGRNWIQRQQMQFPRMDVHFHYTYTLSNWW